MSKFGVFVLKFVALTALFMLPAYIILSAMSAHAYEPPPKFDLVCHNSIMSMHLSVDTGRKMAFSHAEGFAYVADPIQVSGPVVTLGKSTINAASGEWNSVMPGGVMRGNCRKSAFTGSKLAAAYDADRLKAIIKN